MERGASPEGPHERPGDKEIARIVLKLLRNYWLYFTKANEINSDGIRLLASALRYARSASPQVRRELKASIKERTLESVVKLSQSLNIDEELLRELLELASSRNLYTYLHNNSLGDSSSSSHLRG